MIRSKHFLESFSNVFFQIHCFLRGRYIIAVLLVVGLVLSVVTCSFDGYVKVAVRSDQPVVILIRIFNILETWDAVEESLVNSVCRPETVFGIKGVSR